MPELQIDCLGNFQVALAGMPPLTFQADKARALLAYLALERQVHQRNTLAQFLWPGYSEESARNSLRQVLHQLRQALPDHDTEPAWLLLTRQTIQLNPDAPIRIDVITFTQLLAECAAHPHADLASCAPCLARLQQAVDLYQGDFLNGLSVIDSDEFEEWRRITQEHLHIQMLGALNHLTMAGESTGDGEKAIRYAQRQLALEPWLEAAHRQIMRILTQRGQRAAAIAQYQRCRQVLSAELGVEPDDETNALYEQIRSGQPLAPSLPSTVIAPLTPPPPVEQPAAPAKVAPWSAQLPPLLGRAAELAQLLTLLDQPTCRLVTLVGPPGVGKTRLAQAVLESSQWVGGGYFIELATLREATLLATTIAQALTAAHPTLHFTGERLLENLRDQRMLLVLDNFEQVLPGVALIGQLLAHCPALKLLITSRAALRSGGEQVITVYPLPVPELPVPKGQPAPSAITLASVAQNGAVQLFCQRAAAVAPTFVLTERLAPIVVEICQRLDGLPLAIELAAAHSRLLPPPALLERLAQRLTLLTSPSPARPKRQQTLRAALAWSYELLDAEEQRLFRQLSVFVGGATLSAIEAVVDHRQEPRQESPTPSVGASTLLAGVEALLDKSLLRQVEGGDGGEPRVVMLETLREYGWELLATAGPDDADAPQRHANYFLGLAESAAPKLHGPDQVAWLDRLALDHDNLRAALLWFDQAGEAIKALRLATALRYFWRVRGHYGEGSGRLLAILAQPAAAPTGGPTDAVRARALNAAGYLHWVQGETAAAQILLQEALSLGRAVADPAAIAFALRYLGLAAAARQDHATARPRLEESLAIYRTLDTPNETASALMYLGDAAFDQQAHEEAQQLYQESADLLRRLGNHVVLPYALRHLGYLALGRGQLAEALRLCTESLRLNLAAGEQQGSAAALTAVAAVAVAGECWPQGVRLLDCVAGWLATSRAQLLPRDRAYYEATRQRLQQQAQASAPSTFVAETTPLVLAQALAYVQQELAFAKPPAQVQRVDEAGARPALAPTGAQGSTAQAPAHNLPTTFTPFVGRTDATAEILSRLAQGGRLLTLIGPGGIGKTRLALEIGRQQLGAFVDGVWFVALAPLSNATELPAAIATALGIAQQGDPRGLLLQLLRPKRLLLILDNFEHLLAAGVASPLDLVVDLLNAAPGVQMLVTSRERLKLRDEQLYPVKALPFIEQATVPARPAVSGPVTPSPSYLVTADPRTTSPDHQLPVALPPLIGRERELAEIVSRLRQPGARMLTLSGPGGMGKTRLALAAAAQVAPHFAAGVCLVELAELTEPMLLPQTVAAALGQSEQAEAGGEDSVARYLGHKALLLVLDNCEHVAEAAAYWSRRWLSACPKLCILATSHGALAIPGEAVWPVPTLAYPSTVELAADQLLAFAAVQLFVKRAQEVKADFALTAANGSAIAEICRRLEGIPLALELAAARVQSLTPTEIALRLNKGFAAALANNRSAPARHQTMQAALDWSFVLLDGDEQLLFRQLAVFAGGFTLTALESVTQRPDALDLLERLIGRALVLTETQGEQSRYRLLGIIRKYADDKLSASGMALVLRQRHAAYFLHLAESTQMNVQADGEALWLQPEAENFSSAIDWALANAEASVAVRLAGALTWYWWMRGYLRSQRTALQQALAHLDAVPQQQAPAARADTPNDDLRAPALRTLAAGALLALWEEPDKARLAFTQALALAETAPQQQLIGLALRRLAAVAIQQKADEAANEFIERGLVVWQALGGIWHVAWLYALQGDLANQRGDYDQAWLAYEASSRLPVDPGARAYPLRRMAYLALARGDGEHALALCRESLQLNLASGDRQGIAACLVGVARFTVAGVQTLPQAASLPLLRRAAELLGAVEALLQTVEGRLLQADEGAYQQTVRLLQEQLAARGSGTYQAALTAGRGLTVQQATALALQEEAITLPVEPRRPQEPASLPSDKATSASVTSTSSVTEAPSHSFTLPPPHPSPPAPLLDWAEMPAVDFFVERRTEVAQITAWLTPAGGGKAAQLISILGMGGMGKTTLAAIVTKAVAPHFAVIIWRSLLNAPPLSELLRNWLQTLSRQTLATLPDTLDEQLRLLLSYLQQERCLLVLDNVESIFAADKLGEAPQSRAGVVRPGYEDYDQLWQRVADSEHQSCLLLTSREQPYALLRARRQAQATGRIQVLPLTGLDPEAGSALLQSNGLSTSAAEAAQLVKNYSGNPLALQIVAATIADFFGGDVAAFQAEEGALFDGIRLVLDQQVARLSTVEREILFWLAIERDAVTIQLLRSNLAQPVSTGELLEALQALQNRSLLEKRDSGLSLQNVIIEYATEYLVQQVAQEILDSSVDERLSESQSLSSKDPKAKIQNLYLNRFALLNAHAKEHIRQTQKRLIVQPLAERLVTNLGRAEALARMLRWLDRLRAAGVRTGYAGGNLLNLLVQLGADLTNVDCSQLAVWQADLRGVMFAGINFTGADLTHTAFTANIDMGKIQFQPSGDLLIAGISKGELCLWRTVDGQLTDAARWTNNSRLPLLFSDDGQWLVVTNFNYVIQVWSTEQHVCVQTLSGPQSAIHVLAMSKDNTYLASGSADGQVYLWEWRSGRLHQQLTGYALGNGALAFSADSKTLATGSSDGIIRLWEVQSPTTTGHLRATIPAHDHAVGALAFSPDGRWLASGGHGGNIRLWDRHSIDQPALRLQGHTSIIRNLCFQPVSATGSPATYLLASASADQTVRLWTLTGELRYTLLGHTNDIIGLAFSPDGHQLVSSGSDQSLYWWDIRTGQAINTLQAYRHGPTTIVRFSPDGELAVSGSADQLVRLWPVTANAPAEPTTENSRCAVLRGHSQFVRAVAVSPNGQIIASGGADNTIRLWDRTTQTELRTLTGHTNHILSLAFTRTGSDSALLASASADHTIRLWSITESQPQVAPRQRVLLGHDEEILTLAFDATGQTLVSGGMNGSVCLWNVASGGPRQRLTGHTAAVTMVAISPDGSTLASSAFDQTIRLWDLATGRCLQVKKDEHVGTRAVVFGGQPGTAGEFLAYDGDDFAIYLWPWRTGGPATALRGHNGVILGLDVSPTAPLLVSLSKDGTVRLWDLESRRCRQVFRAPGPYAGMQISGVTGISAAQKVALRGLGAVE